MRRLKRVKESLNPPRQPTLPGKPVDIAAGPPDFRTEPDDNSDGGRSFSSQVPVIKERYKEGSQLPLRVIRLDK